jgi:hypothetical protein
MEPIKVVARYTNGSMIKGLTYDFFPNKDRFHIIPVDNRAGETIEVIVNHLKGVFMVRDFSGDAKYKERKTYKEGDTPYGVPLEVTFADGEVMVGSSMGFDPKRIGFFISPVDPMNNNVRVFAVISSIKGIRQLFPKTGMSIAVPLRRKGMSDRGKSCKVLSPLLTNLATH